MKYIFVVINMVLLAILAFLGVEVMYKGIETALTDFSVSPAVPVRDAAGIQQEGTTVRRNSYQRVVSRNVFSVLRDQGDENAAKAETTYEDIAHLKATTLDLKLLGTVTGSARTAYAVIADRRNRSQSLYREGDEVQDAVVKNILRQRVVLNYKGEDQVLEMDFAGRRPGKEAPPPRRDAAASTEVNVDRSLINQSFNNINELMKQIRVKPHFENGKPEGLKLYGIRKGSLFQKMGLRNGDIIKGVDGSQIESVDDALKLYNNLRNTSNVSVRIKRDGRTEEIDYYVQ